MKKARALGAASFSLFFLLSVFASGHVQAATDGPADAPSPLSAVLHDFTTWLNRAVGNGGNNHRANRHPPPLPRARPAKLASPPLASNKQTSEFVPPPGASKKKPPTLVQIND